MFTIISPNTGEGIAPFQCCSRTAQCDPLPCSFVRGFPCPCESFHEPTFTHEFLKFHDDVPWYRLKKKSIVLGAWWIVLSLEMHVFWFWGIFLQLCLITFFFYFLNSPFLESFYFDRWPFWVSPLIFLLFISYVSFISFYSTFWEITSNPPSNASVEFFISAIIFLVLKSSFLFALKCFYFKAHISAIYCLLPWIASFSLYCFNFP